MRAIEPGIRKESKIFTSLVVIMMIANVYVLPFFSVLGIGEVLFILFFPYFFIRLRNRSTISISLFLFVVYSAFLTIMMALSASTSISDPIFRMIRDFVYILIIFIFGREYIDKALLIQQIKLFCKILSIFILLQCAVYYVFHIYIPGIPYNVLTGDGGLTGKGIADTCLSYVRNAGYLKPPGFLCEAAHCAQCLLIGVCVCLFPSDMEERIDIKWAVIFSGVALLTMSAAAFIYIVVIWLFVLFASKGVASKYKILIVVILIFSSVVIIQSGILEPIYGRLSRISELNVASDNSTWFRISRGFNIWSMELSPIQKIFGVGFGNIEGVLGIENEYMNSIAYLLISVGIVGCVLYYRMILKMVKLRDNMSRALIISMIMMASCSSIYSSAIYVWGMLLLIAARKADTCIS